MIIKMDDREYHSHEYLSQSQLKKFIESPLKYDYNRDKKTPSTQAMNDGSAIHCFALEPELFKTYFYVHGGDFRKKEDKDKKAQKEKEGLIVVKEKDIEHYKAMGSVLYKACGLKEIPCEQKELAAFRKIYGVDCRGKVDFIDNDGFLWDIKTTQSIDLKYTSDGDPYWPSMFTYGYDIQACFYLALFSEADPQGFNIAVIEKTPPYDYMFFQVSSEIILRAKARIKAGLENYKNCVATNTWPGYTKKLQKLSLPHYLKD